LARGNESDDSQIFKRSKEQKLIDYVSRNKIKPKQVISIGDSEEEIEIGKKCGFYSVALTGGWNSTNRLKKHKPDFLIHNLSEVKNIIKRLNRK
jgi:phosphoglycolate phosphatase-like HAD superfamily hydrolase